MALIPAPIVDHYELMQWLNLKTLNTTRRAWAGINTYRIAESWGTAVEQLEPLFAEVQERAAGSAAWSINAALQVQGYAKPGEWAVNPQAFNLVNTRALYDPAITALTKIKEGASPLIALKYARTQLDRTVKGVINGASDDAANIEIAARPTVKYVRMVNPPSCARCIQLAGRIYRWNTGFERHPHCDCRHVPTEISDIAEAMVNGLMDDPNEVFANMGDAEIKALEKSLGKASVEALRAGADFSQIVNAKRGQHYKNGSWNSFSTTAGTGSGGYAKSLGFGKDKKTGKITTRLTPKTLLTLSGGDRTEYQWLLKEHGYLLPDGVTLLGKDYQKGDLKLRRAEAKEAARQARAQQMRNEHAQWRSAGYTPEPASSGAGGKPPTRVPSMAAALPEETPKPRATWERAQHALDGHAHDAPNEEKNTYYPKGYFGPHDDDVQAMRYLMNDVVDTGEVRYEDGAYLYTKTVAEVTSEVPVRLRDDGSGAWEQRSCYPTEGTDVEICIGGIRYPLN